MTIVPDYCAIVSFVEMEYDLKSIILEKNRPIIGVFLLPYEIMSFRENACDSLLLFVAIVA